MIVTVTREVRINLVKNWLKVTWWVFGVPVYTRWEQLQ